MAHIPTSGSDDKEVFLFRSLKGRAEKLLAHPLLQNIGLVYSVSAVQFGISLLSNVVVPAVASKATYAEYRLVVLLTSYAGFMHFGLLNGFYLYIISHELNAQTKYNANRIQRTLIYLQLAVVPIVILGLLLIQPANLSHVVLIACAISWPLSNLITFYNYLYQGTENFFIYARTNLVASGVGGILLLSLIFLKQTSTIPLMIVFVGPLFLALLLYGLLGEKVQKDKTPFCSTDIYHDSFSIRSVWRRGLVLFGANGMILLLFSFSNIFVNFRFGPVAFADYSLVSGLASIAYVAFDAISLAVVPYLSRGGSSGHRDETSQFAVLLLVWLAPLIYWVANVVVMRWLPHYTEALSFLMPFVAALPFSALFRSRIVSFATAHGLETLLFVISTLGLAIVVSMVVIAVQIRPTASTVAWAWLGAIAPTATLGAVFVSRRLALDRKPTALVLSGNAFLASFSFLICSRLDHPAAAVIYLAIGGVPVMAYWNRYMKSQGAALVR